MCGRFASTLPPEMMAKLFRTTGALPNPGPSWNMAPTQDAMVVRRHPETGERRLDVLQWGLIPHFTIDLKAARKPINARSETAGTSGMFRGALASRRTIVPCEAFYEWKTMADGKQPYAIARRDGAQLAALGRRTGPDILGKTQQVSVRILDEEFPLATFPISGPIPCILRCSE